MDSVPIIGPQVPPYGLMRTIIVFKQTKAPVTIEESLIPHIMFIALSGGWLNLAELNQQLSGLDLPGEMVLVIHPVISSSMHLVSPAKADHLFGRHC